MVIYKITNVSNGMFYIGQTVRNPNKRWKEHKNNAVKKTHTPLYHAMNFYGLDSFKFEVLEKFSNFEELNKKEEELTLNNLYPLGYNLKNGGNNRRYSELSKSRISAGNKGKKRSETVRSKLSVITTEQNKNNPELKQRRLEGLSKTVSSEKFKEDTSIRTKKLWQDPEYRERICKLRKGKIKTSEHKAAMKEGMLKAHAKPFEVHKLDENGNKILIGVWQNVGVCVKELNLNQPYVSTLLNKHKDKNRTHKGYTFKFL